MYKLVNAVTGKVSFCKDEGEVVNVVNEVINDKVEAEAFGKWCRGAEPGQKYAENDIFDIEVI